MKILLKKNAAANELELEKRLQGLTATDVTHSRMIKRRLSLYNTMISTDTVKIHILNNLALYAYFIPEIRQGFQLPLICIVLWLRYASSLHLFSFYLPFLRITDMTSDDI